MGFINSVLLILIIALISAALDRWWQGRGAEQSETAVATESNGGNNGFWARLTGRNKINQSQLFQEWVTDHFNDEAELQTWLTSLPDDGKEALTKQLNAFCKDLNINLSLLITGKLDQDTELMQAAKDVVVSYCQSCWQAVQIQANMKAFQAFQELQENPDDKKHRAFSQHLHLNLIEADLADTPIVSEIMTLSDKERHQKAIQAINKAAEKDRVAFNKVLQETLTVMNKAQESSKSSSTLWQRLTGFGKQDETTAKQDEQPMPAPAAT